MCCRRYCRPPRTCSDVTSVQLPTRAASTSMSKDRQGQPLTKASSSGDGSSHSKRLSRALTAAGAGAGAHYSMSGMPLMTSSCRATILPCASRCSCSIVDYRFHSDCCHQHSSQAMTCHPDYSVRGTSSCAEMTQTRVVETTVSPQSPSPFPSPTQATSGSHSP